MFGFELWMFPIGIILAALGLIAAGYVWGFALDIKQRLTSYRTANDHLRGDTDE